jgi:uncharacterized protein DUF4190
MYQQPAPGYQTPPNAPGAVLSLVLGIVGIVVCGIAAPFAWAQGRNAERAIAGAPPGAYSGKGMATAGKILGIIGTALLAIGVVALILLIVLGAASSS